MKFDLRLFDLRRLFIGTNCEVNLGLGVNSYNLYKLLVKKHYFEVIRFTPIYVAFILSPTAT